MMNMWLAPIVGLLLSVPAIGAQSVDSVLAELAQAGVGKVTGYPESQSCSTALGEGGRCVGADRHACKSGLICFRWLPGLGRCEKPSWLDTNGVYDTSDLLGASAGCEGGSSGGSPSPSPSPSGGCTGGCAADFKTCARGFDNPEVLKCCSEGFVCTQRDDKLATCRRKNESVNGKINGTPYEGTIRTCSGPTSLPPPTSIPAPAPTGGCAGGCAADFKTCARGFDNPEVLKCCSEGFVCTQRDDKLATCRRKNEIVNGKINGTPYEGTIRKCTGSATSAPPPAPKPAPPAPKPAPPAPPTPAPSSSIPGVFKSSTNSCRDTTSSLPAGAPPNFLNVPEKAQELGDYPADGKVQLKFDQIPLGGSYCATAQSDKIYFGGTLIFNNKGKCNLPPTKSDGSPCCQIKAWQPSSGGFYYDNCSMLQKIGGDGLYYFETELPGDESEVGWGPDNKPHIHYQIECSNCKASDAFDGASKTVKNKVYPEDLCTLSKCGNPGSEHQANEVASGIYKYDIVL